MMRAVLLFFALGSGCASLIYQVVWARELGTVFGTTAHAVSTVLAAFMAGLGAGSLWFAARVERVRQPLRLYGAVELAIAASVVAAEYLIFRIPAISGSLYGTTAIPWLFPLVRFVLVFLLIAAPTFLMGGTLPVLARLWFRSGHIGVASGWLYGVNTIGAAAGALGCGFILIERFGVTGAFLTAVFINVAIGLASIAIRLPDIDEFAETKIAENFDDRAWRTGAVSYALSGFVALGLENLWSRTLVFSIGSTTYSLTAVLVLVLFGLSVGSLAASLLLRRFGHSAPWTAITQFGIGSLALVSLHLYGPIGLALRERLQFREDMAWLQKLSVHFLEASVLVLPVSILCGMMLPFAASGLSSTRASGRFGRLLGANTLAAVAGSLATGFLLIPSLGVTRSYIVLGFVSIAAGVLAVRSNALRLSATGAFALIAAVSFGLVAPLEPIRPTEKLLFYEEGISGTVSVVEDFGGDRRLMIDHIAVAGTDYVFMTDQKSLAHLPMLLHPQPRTALTIGFGSGGASYSFLTYQELERLDVVEIDPAVLRAAPHFQKINGGVLANPKLRVIQDDARSLLLHTRESYDIITTDCTDLRYKSSALLYTKEFFESARRRLAPGGMVVAWVPLGGLAERDLKSVVRTFSSAFEATTGWYMFNYPTHYLLLVGGDSSPRVNLERVQQRLAQPDVRRDLDEIQLGDPIKVLSSYMKNHAQMVAFGNGAPLNSDRSPFLEFSVPKGGFEFSIADNLESFSRDAADPAEILASPINLEKVRRARDLIVQGHVLFNRFNTQYRAALEMYERAAEVDPEDASIPVLIENTRRSADIRMRELETLVSGSGAAPEELIELGMFREYSGDLEGAAALYERSAELAPSRPEPFVNWGRALDKLKRPDLSIARYEDALKLDPLNAVAMSNLGLVRLQAGDLSAAEVLFERAISVNPRLAPAWFNLGLLRLRSGKNAVAAFDSALAIQPGHTDAYLNRGVAKFQSGDVNGAEADLQVAMSRNPQDAEAPYNLGILSEQRRRRSEAESHYRKAIQRNPRHVMAHNNLGVLLSETGRTAEAIDTYRSAIALDAGNAQLRNNLGMELARAGQLDRAIREYEEAIRLNAGMIEPYANLALIYRRQNRPNDAERYVQLARRIDPGFRLP